MQEVENLNTWSTSWIGPAYFLENGWAYHANLGWIYVQQISLTQHGYGQKNGIGYG